jgi:hypothetical protein
MWCYYSVVDNLPSAWWEPKSLTTATEIEHQWQFWCSAVLLWSSKFLSSAQLQHRIKTVASSLFLSLLKWALPWTIKHCSSKTQVVRTHQFLKVPPHIFNVEQVLMLIFMLKCYKLHFREVIILLFNLTAVRPKSEKQWNIWNFIEDFPEWH